MSRPTIVYLHGFRSSPASVKAAAVTAAVEAIGEAARLRLHVPALEFAPRQAVAAVDAWVRRHVADPGASFTFVGSSLGGFYATCLAERLGVRAVLVNPAIRPYDDLAAYAGPQTNLYTGATFVVTPAHFYELRALAVRHRHKCDPNTAHGAETQPACTSHRRGCQRTWRTCPPAGSMGYKP